MSKIDIEGAYLKIGGQLKSENLSLLIVDRKNPTPNKPKNYLLAKLPNRKNKQYISSLYHTNSTGVYSLDYLGVNYTLTIREQEAVISQVSKDDTL